MAKREIEPINMASSSVTVETIRSINNTLNRDLKRRIRRMEIAVVDSVYYPDGVDENVGRGEHNIGFVNRTFVNVKITYYDENDEALMVHRLTSFHKDDSFVVDWSKDLIKVN